MTNYSQEKIIIFGAPQKNMRRLLLYFNIFSCGLFTLTNGTGIASYADDDTLYANENTRCKFIKQLEELSSFQIKK